MFPLSIFQPRSVSPSTAQLLARLSQCCSRPRYAFMMLTLLAEAARSDGSAGPLVAHDGRLTPLRDWLCEALSPMAERDARRRAMEARVRHELAGTLLPDPAAAERQVHEEMRQRILAAGKTNVSRTVSELVKAGLLSRHYQGYRVDHENRGAQRQAVYTLLGEARMLLRRPAAAPVKPRQMDLF